MLYLIYRKYVLFNRSECFLILVNILICDIIKTIDIANQQIRCHLHLYSFSGQIWNSSKTVEREATDVSCHCIIMQTISGFPTHPCFEASVKWQRRDPYLEMWYKFFVDKALDRDILAVETFSSDLYYCLVCREV